MYNLKGMVVRLIYVFYCNFVCINSLNFMFFNKIIYVHNLLYFFVIFNFYCKTVMSWQSLSSSLKWCQNNFSILNRTHTKLFWSQTLKNTALGTLFICWTANLYEGVFRYGELTRTAHSGLRRCLVRKLGHNNIW